MLRSTVGGIVWAPRRDEISTTRRRTSRTFVAELRESQLQVGDLMYVEACHVSLTPSLPESAYTSRIRVTRISLVGGVGRPTRTLTNRSDMFRAGFGRLVVRANLERSKRWGISPMVRTLYKAERICTCLVLSWRPRGVVTAYTSRHGRRANLHQVPTGYSRAV